MAEPTSSTRFRQNLSAEVGEDKVRGLFDTIFRRYDLLNTLMSAGGHYRWRKLAIRMAAPPPGGKALDLCCGTGDFAFALRRYMGAEAGIIGLDFSHGMLEVALQKNERKGNEITFTQGNALSLPFEDGIFDIATNGFGMRNLVDMRRGLNEMRRVLKPGGRAVVLEIVNPQRGPLRPFFALWFDRLVPILGRFGDKAGAAYSYLPASVKKYPEPNEFSGMMRAVGFGSIETRILGGGIIALHIGLRKI